MYIAHYNHSKEAKPHYLKDHVDEMLEMVKYFTTSFDYYGLTEASVILHDVGKKSKQFQEYVKNPNGKRGTVQHAIGGAYALHKKSDKLKREDRYFSELIQLIVAGHHTGLSNYDKNFFDWLNDLPSEQCAIETLAFKEVQEALSLLNSSPSKEVLHSIGVDKFPIYISILIRFVMSALVDADYLSTEAYFSKRNANMRKYEQPSFANFQTLLYKYIDKEYGSKSDTFLNSLKSTIQDKAFKVGAEPYSFFTLHAPTGTGKTIASLQFAVNHAKKHNKSRIITLLPLVNLTEEISETYRRIFGAEHVIEDHSSISFVDREYSSVRQAAENWNRRFVVSTTVQLFESLFHHRPMKLRKLHRIANSILIFDEYHKLPQHVLQPILQYLDILQSKFNVTVLFMSATPLPILDSQKIQDMNLLNFPREVINYKGISDRVPSRITYELEENPLSLKEVAEKLSKEISVLAIVNTRKEAQQLYQQLKENRSNQFENIYHLSTTMCSRHREKVLNDIRSKRSPENPRPIAVIGTSVMEAGIDISFPVVYRMFAPLDSIVQAAGRCNRYHEIEKGRVILFENKNQAGVDPSYKTGINQTKALIKNNGLEALKDPGSFIPFYKRLFHSEDLNTLDINQNNCLYFKDISERFNMIIDNRLLVICSNYKGFQEKWLNENKSPNWWRKIQPFTVSIPSNSKNYKEKEGVYIWTGDYDEAQGIIL